MADITRLVRENVRSLLPYSTARDEFKGKDGIFLDANENPYGTLNRYPDPYQKELKKAISSFKGIPEEKIFLGNGSDEIIDLCFRVFCNPGTDKALIFTPTYGMYEVSAAINNIEIVRSQLTEEFGIDLQNVLLLPELPDIKLIFICSPNNPTGNSMNWQVVESIISKFNGIVIIDEAYVDFSEQDSFLSLLERYENLIIMQTFSKAMGLAAARVGVAFMAPELLLYFNKMKPPYNVSTLNQKAAIRCLKNAEVLKNKITLIKTERKRVAESLKKLGIIDKVFPSDANFLLVKTVNADRIYETLIENQIVVRNRNKVVANCLRITIGTKSENNILIKVLQNINI